MRILLTGANGYIGKRLIPLLVEQKHEVLCMVRDPRRFDLAATLKEKVQVVKGDLLIPELLTQLPTDIDAAYYLVHSMGGSGQNFAELEMRAAKNFVAYLDTTSAQQVVYLSGIANVENLSKHLSSRYHVETILNSANAKLTVLRAAIIIGSGSASFEILRDLVEKLPLMITPKWLRSRCQPIAIRDVMYYLTQVLGNTACYGKGFEIGGPDVLTYKEMILRFARLRGLKRYLISVPVLTPRISSYWLYFVTSTSFSLAKSLVDSLRNDVVVIDHSIENILPHQCISYDEAIRLAYSKIEQNMVISSWKDALVSGTMHLNYMDFVQIPEFGVLTDKQRLKFERPVHEVMQNIWEIGGERGWYKTDFLWRIRGLLDKMAGGVGLRRGRRSATELKAGDTIDFWRVLVADEQQKRLLLYAEMKLPGEAWLQFKICEEADGNYLEQLAAYRPNGILGRLYWYAVLPFHFIIFGGMIRNIIEFRK
ncbi:SDR family oxidoreductase [Pontibacter cellulosilyticus]|uniref:SDR family oxidoreductase n=1 Tax=Pontibacter cellulosilyticus TaxID=1720253 RepID=A0A923N8R2_9BACT|nr:SDR family oxidoreductase [Pontibacter cellulosilyticus]MBC5992510.1 SDR family oxidoreductase [Pontibacter cellulosilyticus]